jgi:hypothetical protein
MDFYAVVYNRNYAQFDVLQRRFNIMISAGHLWNKNFRDPFIPPNTDKFFIDSGGYQFINKYGEYPFSPQEYVEYVDKLSPDMFAVMDHPCEKQVLDKHNVTVKEQIHRTIDNHINILELEPKTKLIPVIQGWKPEDYIYCIDVMKEHDLLSDYVAVGSLCTRKKIVTPVLKNILPNLPKGTKIHGFGLKISNLKDKFVFDSLYSSDSMAWLFVHRLGRFLIFTGTRLVEVNSHNKLTDVERARLSLKAYLDYVDYIKMNQMAQQKLTEHSLIND